MRDSRIAHPLGGRGVMIRFWAVAELGLAAAAVLDVLDFLDRRETEGGQFVATRARIIAELEGIVGRQAVDAALKTLIERGWVRRVARTAPAARNIQTTYHFSLDTAEINNWIFRNSKNGTPAFPELEPVPEPVPEPAAEFPIYVDVYENVDAAASHARTHAHAHAREEDAPSPVAAAAVQHGKARRVRASGLITWTPEDIQEAERLEAEVPADELTEAVAAVRQAGREPVPGLVAIQLERIRRSREAEARRTQAEAQRRARLAAAPASDPEAAAKGRAFLEAIRRRRQAGQGEVAAC